MPQGRLLTECASAYESFTFIDMFPANLYPVLKMVSKKDKESAAGNQALTKFRYFGHAYYMTLSIANIEINRVHWSDFREIAGSAANIPLALQELLTAVTHEDSEAAYWKLENRIVVQGQLFEVAEFVVPVLLAALLEPRPSWVTRGILELLLQIVLGECHEDEVALGNADLGDRCREKARQGLWVLYGELMRGERDSAREVIEAIELDTARLDTFIKAASRN